MTSESKEELLVCRKRDWSLSVAVAAVGCLLLCGFLAAAAACKYYMLWYNGYFTEFGPGYSDSAFEAVKIGDTGESVLGNLGEPILKTPSRYTRWEWYDEQICVVLENARVIRLDDPKGVLEGKSLGPGANDALLELLGDPDFFLHDDPVFEVWWYTRPRSDTDYMVRTVVFDLETGRVVEKVRRRAQHGSH